MEVKENNMSEWDIRIICDALKEYLSCAVNEGIDDENDPHADNRMYCLKILQLLNKLEIQLGRDKTTYINL